MCGRILLLCAIAVTAGGCVDTLRRTANEDRLISPHIDGAVYRSGDATPEALIVAYHSRAQFRHMRSVFYLRVPLDERGVPRPPFDFAQVSELNPRLGQRVPIEQRAAVHRAVGASWTSEGAAAARSPSFRPFPTFGPAATHTLCASWNTRGADSVLVLAVVPGADDRQRSRDRASVRARSMGQSQAAPETLFVVVPAVLREPAEMRRAKQRFAAQAMPAAVAHDAVTAMVHPFWVAGVLGNHVADGAKQQE